MIVRGIVASVALAVCACILTASAQEEKKATGNVVGAVKALHNTKDGKNSMLEVLAPGEEVTRELLDALLAARAAGVRIAYATDPTLSTLRVLA